MAATLLVRPPLEHPILWRQGAHCAGFQMRLDDDAIREHVFEVEPVGKPLEDTRKGPSAEPFEDAVPVAEMLQKVTPWRSGAGPPQHCLEKHSARCGGDTRIGFPSEQNGASPRPHGVASTTLSSFICHLLRLLMPPFGVPCEENGIDCSDLQPECQRGMARRKALLTRTVIAGLTAMAPADS